MNYQFHLDTNVDLMDKFVMDSDQNSLFQCSSWAKVKANWDHLFTSVTDEDGNIVATAMILIRKMPLGTTLFYIPRGPVMDYQNQELVSFTLDSIKHEAKKRKAMAVRFDPSILSREYSYLDRKNEHPYENNDVIETLKRYGAKHKGFTTMIAESTQPRFNAATDVDPDYKDHMERKAFKRINTSIHEGNQLYVGHEYLHDFATAMHYTEVRKQVALRNEDYFAHMMEVYGDHALCMVTKLNFPEQIKKFKEDIAETQKKFDDGLVTRKQRPMLEAQLKRDKKELALLEEDYAREGKDEVITCGILAVYNKNLMEILYMGNHPDYMRTYASYLLYSKCLDKCVEENIKHCSYGGVEGTLDDGLTLFKAHWMMNVEEYIGEFNIVLKPVIYHAFDTVYPKVLAAAAKMRGSK